MSVSKLYLRKARPHDVLDIAKFNWMLVSDNPSENSADCDFNEHEVYAQTLKNFDPSHYFMAIAEHDDGRCELAGQIKCTENISDLTSQPCLFLAHAYTVESCRNAGCLQSLMQFAELKYGISNWCLMVVSNTSRAKYEHLGFRSIANWMIRDK